MATKSRLMAYVNGVKRLTDKETQKARKTSVLSNLAQKKAKKEEK